MRLYRDANSNGILDAGDTQLGSNLDYIQDDGTVKFDFAGAMITVRSRRLGLTPDMAFENN